MFYLESSTKAKLTDSDVLSQKNRPPDSNPGVKLAFTAEMPNGALTMWAVHVHGPDEIYAAPDRAAADAVSLLLNRQFQRSPVAGIPMGAEVIEWPYGYEAWSAQKDLLRLDFAPLPAVPRAQRGSHE